MKKFFDGLKKLWKEDDYFRIFASMNIIVIVFLTMIVLSMYKKEVLVRFVSPVRPYGSNINNNNNDLWQYK